MSLERAIPAKSSRERTISQVTIILSVDEPVAIKVIDMKMLKCEVNRTLLNNEIENLKKLNMTLSILQLYEVYNTKNNTYIITELCDSDLSKKIKKKLG